MKRTRNSASGTHRTAGVKAHPGRNARSIKSFPLVLHEEDDGNQQHYQQDNDQYQKEGDVLLHLPHPALRGLCRR